MRNCGISLEAIQPVGHLTGKDGELVNNASESSELPSETCLVEKHCEVDMSSKGSMETCDLGINKEKPPGPVNGFQVQKLPLVSEEDFSNKWQNVGESEEASPIKLKATESSLEEWLKKIDEGVSDDFWIQSVFFVLEKVLQEH